MAHIAEECRLRAVNFGQSLRTFLFRRVGACVGNAGGDLAGDEIDEPGVADIQRTKWIEGRDNHARGLVLTLTRNWQEERSPGCLIPRAGRDRFEPLLQ